MKLHEHLSLLAIVFCSLIACTSENVSDSNELTTIEKSMDSHYDMQMANLARSLTKVLVDIPESRKVVKEGIMLRFDDDYDILLTTLSKQKVSPSASLTMTKGALAETTFGSLLDSFLAGETKSDGLSVLEQLQEEYPELQVSIPVHAEEWDPETYVPVVAYIPENLVDSTATVLPGFNQNGEYVEMDAQIVPDEPVIVISINERSGFLEPILMVPDAPQNLVGIQTANSILLSWTRSINADRYVVYRKAPGQASFGEIGVSEGTNNISFEDTNVLAGVYYQYYVCAQTVQLSSDPSIPSSFVESNPSNLITVQAPSYPNSVSDFEVSLATSDLALLEWNNNGVTGSNIKVDYKYFYYIFNPTYK